MAGSATPAVSDVLAAAQALRADDPLIVDPDTLLADIDALREAIAAMECVLVRRLRSAQATDATAQVAGRSTRAWLVTDRRMAGADASRLLRLAGGLPLHQATAAAHDEGEISSRHADTILTALRSLPPSLRDEVEPHLLDRARTHPPEEIPGFVDELLQRLGLDRESDVRRERRHASRGVDVDPGFDGSRILSGTLTPDVALRFEHALAIASTRTGPDDDRTPRQRRHDALGVIADAYIASDVPSFTGAPRTVIVTMTLAALEQRLRDAAVALPAGPLTAGAARRLACDAGLIPAVLGGHSELLDLGRADHEFSAAIRRAAWLRDGGECAFPRCQSRPAELHHIVFRRHGGPTSLDNAAWLCAMHHWLAHDGGWQLRRTPEGYHWTGPTGTIRLRRLGEISRAGPGPAPPAPQAPDPAGSRPRAG